jgi:hypothetical protein
MGGALGPIAGIAGLVGAGVSAYGQYQSMEAQSADAAYQSQVAANNAKIAKQNAQFETEAGEITASNYGLKTRAAVGSMKAAQAASGVDVNSGSFVEERGAAAELGMLDAMTIRSNAAKKTYGEQVAETSFKAQSQLLKAQSQQADAAAPIAAFGTLLSGASSVGGNYAKYLSTS